MAKKNKWTVPSEEKNWTDRSSETYTIRGIEKKHNGLLFSVVEGGVEDIGDRIRAYNILILFKNISNYDPTIDPSVYKGKKITITKYSGGKEGVVRYVGTIIEIPQEPGISK